MGLARKKSAHKHHQSRSSDVAGSIPPSQPACVQTEFLLIRSDSLSLLVNSVDSVQSAKFFVAEGRLELSCHLVVAFSDGEISGFRLARTKDGLDLPEIQTLDTAAINSPIVGSQHQSLAWAAKSRFVVDTSVLSPGLRIGDLVTIAAQVGTEWRPVSRIYITGVSADMSDK